MFQQIDDIKLKAARGKFVCPEYQPVPGEVRCMQYVGNGACRLPTHLMCVEWLRKSTDEANRASARSLLVTMGVAIPLDLAVPEPAALPASEDDPYGELDEPAVAVAVATTEPAKAPWIGVTESLDEKDGPPIRGDLGLLTDEAISALEVRGLEVDLGTPDLGTITLVPTYTDKDRPELTFRDLRTLVLVGQAISGARLVALRRRPTEDT